MFMAPKGTPGPADRWAPTCSNLQLTAPLPDCLPPWQHPASDSAFRPCTLPMDTCCTVRQEGAEPRAIESPSTTAPVDQGPKTEAELEEGEQRKGAEGRGTEGGGDRAGKQRTGRGTEGQVQKTWVTGLRSRPAAGSA